MQIIWGTIAAISALAIAAGVVYLMQDELRAHRSRQAIKRLRWHVPTQRHNPITRRDMSTGIVTRDADTGRVDYSQFDQEQMLRNRSERWDG